MCLSPTFVWVQRGPGYEKQPVPCKVCRQCRAQRVNDYVGRALCEAAYASSVSTLTLTYAPRDDLADKVLTPSHFQACVRSLRDRRHLLRYIVAGEYGDLKGRAHFHAIIFWQGPAPDMPQKSRFWRDWWPHGHIICDWNADERAVRYVCKYLLKAEPASRWFSLSKKPPIGWQFFEDKAHREADLGVFPSGFSYAPPGGTSGRRYIMTGATRRDYLALLVDLHAERAGIDPATLSEWAKLSLDKLFRWQHGRECDPRFDTRLSDELDQRRPSPGAVAWLLYQTDPANYDWWAYQGGFQEWLKRSVESSIKLPPRPGPRRRGGMSDLSAA